MLPSTLRPRLTYAPVVASVLLFVACLVAPGLARAGTFTGGVITIPDVGAGSPYPADVFASEPNVYVRDVDLRFRLSDDFPDDVDILLRAPSGQTALVLSDVGPSDVASHVTLKLDDEAAAAVPDPLASGTYRPTDLNDGSPDSFPAPAPGGPYSTTLSALDGSPAAGTWSLFVVDDEGGDATGSIDFWSVELDTRVPYRMSEVRQSGTEGEVIPARFTRFGSPASPPQPGSFTWTPEGCSVLYQTRPADPAKDTTGLNGGTVQFAAGQTEQTVDVVTVDDHVPEWDECLYLRASNFAGDLISPTDLGLPVTPVLGVLLRIRDNDPMARVPYVARPGVQRVLKQRAVIVKATSNAYGTLSGRGTIKLPSGAATKVRLKAVRKQVSAGQQTKLRLRLSRAALRQVRLAFANTRRLTARVTVTAKDLAGNTNSRLVRVRLRR